MSDLADSMMAAVARTVVRRHLSDLVEAGVGTEDQFAAAFLVWLQRNIQRNRSDSSEEAALRFRLELLAAMASAPRPEITTIGETS